MEAGRDRQTDRSAGSQTNW